MLYLYVAFSEEQAQAEVSRSAAGANATSADLEASGSLYFTWLFMEYTVYICKGRNDNTRHVPQGHHRGLPERAPIARRHYDDSEGPIETPWCAFLTEIWPIWVHHEPLPENISQTEK